MENQITSTTYVPLHPPYQIIKYANDIGMQIGTLIVTIQKEGNVNGMGYEIETHSHPVVVYENKRTTPKDRQLFGRQFLEGVVWSRVQVKDVSTICLEDSRLPWMQFVEFLRVDMMRRRGIPRPAVHAYDVLRKLGADVEMPESKEYVVKLTKRPNLEDDPRTVVETPYNSVFSLNADASSEEVLLKQLKNQISAYMSIIHRQRMAKGFTVRYEADEPFKNVAEKLNADNHCTSRSVLIVSDPLTIYGVPPYPGVEPE